MNVHRRILGVAALSVTLAAAGACNRDSTNEATDTTADSGLSAPGEQVADANRDRQDDIADLSERVARLERQYAEKSQEVASGARAATAGLREELREDVSNVKEAVNDLGTTTAENWWDRHEQAMARTVADIEADVRRLAGTLPRPSADRPTGTAGATASDAPFTSRRDAFVNDVRARLDAMEDALEKVNARGTKETEIEDTQARVRKLREDAERLQSASADDWWDVSKTRVTEYVEHVEDSVERLDDNRPDASSRTER